MANLEKMAALYVDEGYTELLAEALLRIVGRIIG